MVQSKVTLTEELSDFIADHKELGFKDKSAMVRSALERLKIVMEKEKLKQSAALYAELYASDYESKEWISDKGLKIVFGL